jgi:hypothetical protein
VASGWDSEERDLLLWAALMMAKKEKEADKGEGKRLGYGLLFNYLFS